MSVHESEDRQRADAALAARGLAPSREKARALIEAGLALVNGVPISKPAQKVGPEDVLTVTGDTHPYVSRGGLKLKKAIDAFAVDVPGKVCLDVGASTGGFTDVLLRAGAAHVYAVDVGTGQLDPRLREDRRVTSMERVNARALTRSMFPTPPTLTVMDVSFISVRLILPALFELLGPDGRVLTLVKPQFEAGRASVGKGGIVSSPGAHRRVLREITAFPEALGWRVRALEVSPITGGDGNIEFLADLLPSTQCERSVSEEEIDALVRRAHEKP
ncbi:MAG: TlyA family RNA methyltransferase [Clostridia bacterium]|nr:TlyA family RNA methyltransferase [Clostridia bacterium]